MSDKPCENPQVMFDKRNEQPQVQQDLRHRLDQIDCAIMQLLVQRMELSSAMAVSKKHTHLPLFDDAREQEILKKLPGCCCNSPLGKQSRFCSSGIRIYEEILKQSRRIQAKELLPKIICLLGGSYETRKEISEKLAMLLGFTLLDTTTEWIPPHATGEGHAMWTQLSLQKELIICGDDRWMNQDTDCPWSMDAIAFIFLDEVLSGECQKGTHPTLSGANAHTITLHHQTPTQACAEIIALLRI